MGLLEAASEFFTWRRHFALLETKTQQWLEESFPCGLLASLWPTHDFQGYGKTHQLRQEPSRPPPSSYEP